MLFAASVPAIDLDSSLIPAYKPKRSAIRPRAAIWAKPSWRLQKEVLQQHENIFIHEYHSFTESLSSSPTSLTQITTCFGIIRKAEQATTSTTTYELMLYHKRKLLALTMGLQREMKLPSSRLTIQLKTVQIPMRLRRPWPASWFLK